VVTVVVVARVLPKTRDYLAREAAKSNMSLGRLLDGWSGALPLVYYTR
jgi:hypothetical protein